MEPDAVNFNFPNMFKVSQYDVFMELFHCIYNEYINKRNNSQFHLKVLLMQVLRQIDMELETGNSSYFTSHLEKVNHPKVINAKRYIDSNMKSRLSLNDLAAVAGLSPSFFGRIFKKITGETPISYINRSRINLAKKLLIETDKCVKEICYECGFENENYFYILFKKLEGQSPLHFRELHSSFKHSDFSNL